MKTYIASNMAELQDRLSTNNTLTGSTKDLEESEITSDVYSSDFGAEGSIPIAEWTILKR